MGTEGSGILRVPFTMIFIVSMGVTSLLLGAPAEARQIGAELKSALASLGPGDEVPVIVQLSDRVDLRRFRDRNRGRRRTALVGELR